MNTLASRLLTAMRERNISAPQLARKVGVTKQAVYKWLRGGVLSLDTDVLQRVCEELGVRPEWLVSGKLPKHPSPGLKDEETRLIMDFRGLTPRDRQRLLDLARAWKEESGKK